MQVVLRRARETAIGNLYNLKAHDTPQAQQYFEEYYNKLQAMIVDKEMKLLDYNTSEQLRLGLQYTEIELNKTKKMTGNDEFRIEDIETITQNYEFVIEKAVKDCMGSDHSTQPVGVIAKKVLTDMALLFV